MSALLAARCRYCSEIVVPGHGDGVGIGFGQFVHQSCEDNAVSTWTGTAGAGKSYAEFWSERDRDIIQKMDWFLSVGGELPAEVCTIVNLERALVLVASGLITNEVVPVVEKRLKFLREMQQAARA